MNQTFVERATTGFDAYAATVKAYTLERAFRETGVPAEFIRQMAHDYARADRAQICWTLGITEHHNAAGNVFTLINLALLTGHVGRYGSGLVPLRGQNRCGAAAAWAIPNKLTGFQDVVTNTEARARFEAVYGTPIPPTAGWHLSLMFEAMERRSSPPATSSARTRCARRPTPASRLFGWGGGNRASGLGSGRGLGCTHEPGRVCWFSAGPAF